MGDHQKTSVIKSEFGKFFTPAWNRLKVTAMLQKKILFTGTFSCNYEIIPVHKFLSSEAIQGDLSIAGTFGIPSSQ
jgi:hypothetical protein